MAGYNCNEIFGGDCKSDKEFVTTFCNESIKKYSSESPIREKYIINNPKSWKNDRFYSE